MAGALWIAGPSFFPPKFGRRGRDQAGRVEARERGAPSSVSLELYAAGLPPDLKIRRAATIEDLGLHPGAVGSYRQLVQRRSDEFFRLVNQTFSVIKWTKIRIGVVAGAGLHIPATLIASGRAKTDPAGRTFSSSLRDKLLQSTTPFSVSCSQNGEFDISYQIDPGRFDLVGGANWALSYNGIARC